jgi:hypothetical protein
MRFAPAQINLTEHPRAYAMCEVIELEGVLNVRYGRNGPVIRPKSIFNI